jgi:hypothetical protein
VGHDNLERALGLSFERRARDDSYEENLNRDERKAVIMKTDRRRGNGRNAVELIVLSSLSSSPSLVSDEWGRPSYAALLLKVARPYE